MSTRNSEASSNESSPPSSINMAGNSQVINYNNNAPKYGTVVPNRVFVGGIPQNTTENDLAQLFNKYGKIKATKIIADRAGVPKGYGFITFETIEEAKLLQADANNILLGERRLNIAPAVKKQPFGRIFESLPATTTTSLYYHNGMPYTYHNGMAYFPQAANQGASAVSTPEMPPVYQGSGYGPQNNAQSYGTPMMFHNPMFLSPPQHFNPYLQVSSQGPPPMIYTGGSNPSVNQPPSNPSENNQPVQMSAPPPPPYYIPPTLNTEMYYSNMQPPPSQGCYSQIVALAPHEGMLHYVDVPMEQNSNNLTNTEVSPVADNQANLSTPLNEYLGVDLKPLSKPQTSTQNEVETPVVSLLNVEKKNETIDSANGHTVATNNGHNHNTGYGNEEEIQYNKGRGYLNGMNSFNPNRGRGRINDRHQNVSLRGRKMPNDVDRSSRESTNVYSNGRGGFIKPSTFNGHFDPNNNNNNGIIRCDYSLKGQKFSPRNSVRRGTFNNTSNRGALRNGIREFPKQYYPSSTPFNMAGANALPTSSLINTNLRYNHLQIQPPPIFPPRNFQNSFYIPHYNPHHLNHQNNSPFASPSMPNYQQQVPRRFTNGGKKPSNGVSNNTFNSNRKIKTEGIDCGAAGDSANMPEKMTSPPSPGTNKKNPSGVQDLCTQVQNMNLKN